VAFQYGATGSTLKPVVGDWNGDGVDSIGIYNTKTGVFSLRNSNSAGAADGSFRWTSANKAWLPIVGDWDGNGADSIGLYNATSGTFYHRNVNSSGGAEITARFGPTRTAAPEIGDWNADGIDTIGTYVAKTGTFSLRNTNSAGGADVQFVFRPVSSGGTPLAGRWLASAHSQGWTLDPNATVGSLEAGGTLHPAAGLLLGDQESVAERIHASLNRVESLLDRALTGDLAGPTGAAMEHAAARADDSDLRVDRLSWAHPGDRCESDLAAVLDGLRDLSSRGNSELAADVVLSSFDSVETLLTL